MERIHVLEAAEASPEIQAFYDLLREEFGKTPNLFATVAHHPPALRPLMELFGAAYRQTTLSPRIVELAIIRISYVLQSHYCLTLHKAFALDVGIEGDELRCLAVDPTHALFPPDERALLEFARQYAEDARGVTDAQYAALRETYDEAQVVNLCLLMSLSRLFGDMANAMHIPPDA